jgi:hypothetical protein
MGLTVRFDRFQRWSLYLLVAFLLSTSLTGCGDSNNDFVASGGGTQPGPTATVRLRSVLARAVPGNVDQVRLSGFDNANRLLYGPETRDKAALIDFANVPVNVSELLLEYLDGNQVVGLAQIDVSLTPGAVVTIDDPDFRDVGSGLRSLQVTPQSATIADGTSQRFAALATFLDGSVVDLSSAVTWSSSNPDVATVVGGLA